MSRGCRLALGTVQWGMNYGIANRTGQPRSDEVERMLRLGREHGIQFLDTAYAYGEAEKVLGSQRAAARGYQIVTKTKPLRVQQVDDEHIRSLTDAFEESLTSLACQHVYGLLVHGSDALLVDGGERIWTAMEKIKSDGRVRRIGVSVYHPRQLEPILDRYPIDLVQLPFSVYDQRFTECGLLTRLKRMRIEVHARSAFMQGLLLLSPDHLPDRFQALRVHQARLHVSFRELRLTPLEGCLLYCLQKPEIDRVVIGCETVDQVKAIVSAAGKTGPELANMVGFSVQDEGIINPSLWGTQVAELPAHSQSTR